MLLTELLSALDHVKIHGDCNLAVEITGIAYDSRQVKPGDIFVPWLGGRRSGDGHRFIPQALANGAVAVVAQREGQFDTDLVAAQAALIEVPDTRRALALLADRFYDHPSRRLRLIGITGTNGKTTTAYLVRHLLAGAGRTTGLIGTINYVTGRRTIPADRTTPQAPDFQAMLAEMSASGCRAAVAEVASIALAQQRVAASEFDIGVFTNLSREHLEDHGTMDEYAAAKRKLFEMLGTDGRDGPSRKAGTKWAIVNRDDRWAAMMSAASRVPVLTYGLAATADFRAQQVRVDAQGTCFQLSFPGGGTTVQMPLIGRFNVYNALAALAAAYVEGIAIDRAVEILAAVPPIPGRFERVYAGQQFLVVVDYAHTPEGLAMVLDAARELTDGRLIVVFGCGGERDPGKRPEMGRIAAARADHLVITSDNPRGEDPVAIIDQIERGIAGGPYDARPRELILDRRQAIMRAVTMARSGDVLLIAGKGHEGVQMIGTRSVPFDDRVVVADILRSCAGSRT